MLKGMSPYEINKVSKRQDLHDEAAAAGLRPGNYTAGIVQVGENLCIFWNPYRRLYANKWIDEPREFIYSGEGTTGAMDYTAANRYLIEAENTDRPVTLFYKVEPKGSKWKCIGQFRVTENYPGVSVDTSGKPRPDLRFRLIALDDVTEVTSLPDLPAVPAPPLPDEDSLWAAVEKGIKKNGPGRKRGTTQTKDKRQSDPMKTMYVLRRAIDFGGVCESCLLSPGWLGEDGNPHFQAHHIVADIDVVDWIGAVCGTCHDRLHHGTDRATRADDLRKVVKERQNTMGRPTQELAELLPATA